MKMRRPLMKRVVQVVPRVLKPLRPPRGYSMRRHLMKMR